MKEERMRVLQLVEDGKITVEDATKLLDALTENAAMDFESEPEFESKFNAFAKNAEAFAKDCGGKVSDAFKRMEPKLRKASHTVLKKTAAVMDDISKALNESLQNREKSECCHENDCCCDDDYCCADDCCVDEDCDCGCGCGCDDQPKEN